MSLTAEALDRIIGHMNEDHEDSLVLYAHAYAKRPDVTKAKMRHLTEDEIFLEVDGGEALRIPLTSKVLTPQDAHQVLVAMSKAAKTDR